MADRIVLLCDSRESGAIAGQLVASGFAVERVTLPTVAVDRLAADPRPLVVSASTAKAAAERCQAAGWATSLPVTALLPEPGAPDVTKVLAAGAGSVLPAEIDRRELAARLRAACRSRNGRVAGEARAASRVGSLMVDERAHTATINGRKLSLTPTEFRLLAALARRRGQLAPHEELIDEVWGTDAPGGMRQLRLYIGYLREKLATAREQGAVLVNQRGVGYRLVEASAS